MTPAIAALAALYKPHLSCMEHYRNQTATFFSDTAIAPDEAMITQRNYGKGFSEVIVIAYDAGQHRYVRTQLTSDGAISTATMPGPSNGVWTWASVPVNGGGKPHRIHFGAVNGKLRYWYVNGAYSICS